MALNLDKTIQSAFTRSLIRGHSRSIQATTCRRTTHVRRGRTKTARREDSGGCTRSTSTCTSVSEALLTVGSTDLYVRGWKCKWPMGRGGVMPRWSVLCIHSCASLGPLTTSGQVQFIFSNPLGITKRKENKTKINKTVH